MTPASPVDDALVRILFLSANPDGTAPIHCLRELKAVEAEWNRRDEEGYHDHFARIEHIPAADRSDLSHRLYLKPHIVHFSGHGERDGRLAFESDAAGHDSVNLDELGNLIARIGASVRCVILNACWSANQAEALASHVEYVIGMTWPIPDPAAIEFARVLYRHVFMGNNLQAAFELARDDIGSRPAPIDRWRDFGSRNGIDTIPSSLAEVPKLVCFGAADASTFVIARDCWKSGYTDPVEPFPQPLSQLDVSSFWRTHEVTP